MKHHQNDFETLMIQKKFVEDILSTKFPTEVKEIRRHNDEIADMMRIREMREKKIESLMELKRQRNPELGQVFLTSASGGGSTPFSSKKKPAGKSSQKQNTASDSQSIAGTPGSSNTPNSFEKKPQKPQLDKLNEQLNKLLDEEKADLENEPLEKNALELIDSNVEIFTDFMRDLEKENLRYIQILQGLEEEITISDNQIRVEKKTSESRLKEISLNIE